MEQLPYSPASIQQFWEEHQHDVLTDILLAAKPAMRDETLWMIEQCESRKRLLKKVPEWANRFDLFLPHRDNLSQASSTATAEFKASDMSGDILDLTAGSGIDAWQMAKNAQSLTLVEPNDSLAERTTYNLKQWGIVPVLHNTTAEEFCQGINREYDWIYIDPSRRDSDGSKTVAWHRMLPDVTEIWDKILTHSKKVRVKLSPLFDIHALQNVSGAERIDVVAVRGEVKEVLLTASKEFQGVPEVCAHEIGPDSWHIHGYGEDVSPISKAPETYLYDPSAALIKAGLADSHAAQHQLHAMTPGSLLYTSDKHFENYPGRTFRVLEFNKPYKIKDLPKNLSIVSKGFYDKPQVIRKRLKCGESDTNFLFAVGKSKNAAHFIHAVRIVE